MGNQAVRHHQDDSRRHRHPPSKARDISSEPTKRKSASGKPYERASGRSEQPGWIRFLRRYPLVFLLVAWVTVVLLAGVAILDMTSLGTVKPQAHNMPIAPSPELTAMPSESPLQQISPIQRNPELSPQPRQDTPRYNTSKHNTLPLLSLMAIALSCAVGCMIILQGLKPRRLPERSDSPVVSRSVLSKSVFSKSASHRSKASGVTNSRFQHATSAQSASASAIVPSVVPPNISQPLDWDEPSLADHLDLRQQRPLSHWL